ncbi:hypothetical protein KAFR_0G02880 [Kazachstania africana CBS 2517]|uniref:HIG1 domain-containing protein n=1 Tax=Kazachstania africana (strain ATCC 22294 / BCRC 22015 / CBS 2517 / CECT 1963 / NBRC 1671 / NRRL Y-8276) TaxID=1071382 RepID=H2AY70_KAZAF|nr:hypothetical protein KAFR_0G02880 [Kazachstania africana CBS 2517]CCF59320.1 hypothetical protein KAFR_0G02880 [Kazachstania africana CBS 2517]
MRDHVQPIHYSQATVKELTKQIAVASCIGAFQGGLISITTGLLLRKFSSIYRTVRLPVRVFYHCSWISMGMVFRADKQLIIFQQNYYSQELQRRGKLLDEAADRGIFLEEEAITRSTTNTD